MDNQSDDSSQHFSQPIQPQPSQPFFSQGQPSQPLPQPDYPPPSFPPPQGYPSQPLPQQPYPSGPMPPQKPGLRQRFTRLPLFGKLGIGCGGCLGVLLVCFISAAIAGAIIGPQPSANTAPTVVAQATTQAHPTTQPAVTRQPTRTPAPSATPTLTPTPRPIYPPKTAADLHALAAKGDASAIHEFDAETVGLTGVCPQPKREVTVDPSITGQQLVEDLLAYFYANQLDSACGSVVFAYHTQAEANDVYTAGRILVDTQNMDPNNTHAQRTMTLDSGGLDDPNAQEYMITYTG